MKRLLFALVLAGIATSTFAQQESGVFFVEPKNGAKVEQEFKVVMGVRGMEVKPAGEIAWNTGHHHLLIDASPVRKGAVIPVDLHHLHFGKGQTETMLKLAPGRHTLQLQFADGAHRSFGPAMRATIRVTVR